MNLYWKYFLVSTAFLGIKVYSIAKRLFNNQE